MSDGEEYCEKCGKVTPILSMGHGAYACEICYENSWCTKCGYWLEDNHVCPTREERMERLRKGTREDLESGCDIVSLDLRPTDLDHAEALRDVFMEIIKELDETLQGKK